MVGLGLGLGLRVVGVALAVIRDLLEGAILEKRPGGLDESTGGGKHKQGARPRFDGPSKQGARGSEA